MLEQNGVPPAGNENNGDEEAEGEKLPLTAEEELTQEYGPVVPEGGVRSCSAEARPLQEELGPRCLELQTADSLGEEA